MSALSGRWAFDGKPAGEGCRRVLDAQRLYGPHVADVCDRGEVAFGRALFRTLPEDRFDRQPLEGGGGRWLLVADVRLDNRDDLAAALTIEPPRLASLSDADLLLQAWERWGPELFSRLAGEYAFAVWDAAEHRLFLARDPLGGRPLHYHRSSRAFSFASMPKGLHALPDVPVAPDLDRNLEFLARLPEDGPRSFYKDISRVEAGQLIIVKAESLRITSHWNPASRTGAIPPTRELAEGLRHHLDGAVSACLRGAGNHVGAHLSAGLDSSAVAATAARLLASSNGSVVAFTSVPREGYNEPPPPGRIGDEGAQAALTAALYPNMKHVQVRTGGRPLLELMERNHFLNDRPLLNIENQMWLHRINVEAKARGLSVVLTGASGNMTISYGGREGLAELVAEGRWPELLSTLLGVVRRRRLSLRSALAGAFGPWLSPALWALATRVGRGWTEDLSIYSALGPQARATARDKAAGRGFELGYRPPRDGLAMRVGALRRNDNANFNKGALAGEGIDLRDPTRDLRLVEYCLAIPAPAWIAGGLPRVIGLEALSDRLPPAVLAARGKGYQAVDWHEAVEGQRDALAFEIDRLGRVPVATALLDVERMQALIAALPSGDWNSPMSVRQFRVALMRGIVSGVFLRKASGSNA